MDEDAETLYTQETNLMVEKQHAVRMIERAWCRYRDIRMFRVLKRSICSAENSVTSEVIKKLNPNEAKMLDDPTVTAKVRFRFGGEEFPPIVMFKIFARVGSSNSKYISGKKMIKAESNAARDALRLMGNRRYYDQLLVDAAQRSKYHVTDDLDVSTLRDYMMFQSHQDEMPHYLGGKHNQWRQLTLENLSRKDLLYDVVDYIHSGKRSYRLHEQYPTLPIRRTALTQPAQLEALKRLNEFSKSKKAGSKSARGSTTARKRIARMRKMYGMEQQSLEVGQGEEYSKSGPSYFPELNVTVTSTDDEDDEDDEDWEEAGNLYEWSQELSINDVDYVY